MIDSQTRGGTRFVASLTFVGHDKAWLQDSHAPNNSPLPLGEGRGEGEPPADPRITKIFVLPSPSPFPSPWGRGNCIRVGFVDMDQGHDKAWPSRDTTDSAGSTERLIRMHARGSGVW